MSKKYISVILTLLLTGVGCALRLALGVSTTFGHFPSVSSDARTYPARLDVLENRPAQYPVSACRS